RPAACRLSSRGGRTNPRRGGQTHPRKTVPAPKRGDAMKSIIHAVSIVFAMLVLACFTAAEASAPCRGSDGHLASNPATAMFMRSAARTSKAAGAQGDQGNGVAPAGSAIIGFWHVPFISKGTGFIPDGTVVDRGFAQWHADGTEILNSSR